MVVLQLTITDQHYRQSYLKSHAIQPYLASRRCGLKHRPSSGESKGEYSSSNLDLQPDADLADLSKKLPKGVILKRQDGFDEGERSSLFGGGQSSAFFGEGAGDGLGD